ncbi:MAG: outer membrane protein assembly factor BamE [Burkholderiaceae bacterium]
MTRLPLWGSLGLLLMSLTACSGYAPPDRVVGLTEAQLVAQMGPPDAVRPTETGKRLEFPRGPMGHHTWFADLDAQGRVVGVEQVLTESNFNRIAPGMTQEAVRQRLGRPGAVQRLGRSRGVVWNYRYENPFCRWFQVEIAESQQVRSTGYGEPPECRLDDSDDTIR